MPIVDISDETFLVVPPKVVAAVFGDPHSCQRFWPDLILDVYLDRGDEGLRWTVRGALVGTMEVWLESVMDGTVLHYFLRADPPEDGRRARPRDVRREVIRRRLTAKRIALQLKTTLEAGRQPGCPPGP